MRISIKQLKQLIRESSSDYTRKEEIASEYSDAYKDRYGIRPHHLTMDDWDAMSVEDAEQKLRDLYSDPGYNDAQADESEYGVYSDDHGYNVYDKPTEGSVSSEDTDDDFTDIENAPTRIPFKGGDEYDALSKKGKRYYSWRAGERKRIKKGYNKRLRHKI